MIEQLYKKDLYIKQFEKLTVKANAAPWLLEKHYISESITLGWVLRNRDLVINEIIRTLKEHKYHTPLALEKEVIVDDKKRLLYHFDWHEKILQGVMADVLTSFFEPLFSDSLYSYRRGRGPYDTLTKLSKFIKSIDDDKTIFVIKKDIVGYGDNIQHDLLFKLLEKHLDKEDYFFQVLTNIIKFQYKSTDTSKLEIKQMGLPTGSSINNLMANVFLYELDHELDGFKNSCYFRYGDDICVVTYDKISAENIESTLNHYVVDKKLEFKKEKEINIQICKKKANKVDSFKYLGLVMNVNGDISLSPDKDKELKAEVRRLIVKIKMMLRPLNLSKEKQIEGIIKSYRVLLFKTGLYSQLCTYFSILNDECYWGKLDLWTAKTLLAVVYKHQTDKNFKKLSFTKLRKKGLPSFLHMRRLFLDKSDRLRKYKNLNL